MARLPTDRRRIKTEVATLVIIGVFFVGMFMADLFSDFSIYKLSIPAICDFMGYPPCDP